MLFHLITSILLLSTAIALPTELQECSRTSSQPCKCPSGTVYHTCTTYSTVGANAFDVRKLTGDFYDLRWIPQTIQDKHGPDNTVGSTRTTIIGTDVGLYTWVEELIKYNLVADGSFLWEFELKNVPLYFNPGPGLFAGEWVTFKADYVSEYETNITWNLYGCHTGDMHGYQGFQQIILKHVESLLEADGKIKGNNTDPWTEIGRPQILSLASFVADDDAEPTSIHRPQSQQVLSDGSNGVKTSEDRAGCSDTLTPKAAWRPAAWTPI